MYPRLVKCWGWSFRNAILILQQLTYLMVVEIPDDSHNHLPSKLHLPPTHENKIREISKKIKP